MANQQRNIVGCFNEKRYILVHDKLGNQQACDPEWRNTWLWFLTVDGEFVGSYDKKSEAIDALGA